jgi:hypothetical protein
MIPNKKLSNPPKVLSMNHQDYVGEAIVRGIVLWPTLVQFEQSPLHKALFLWGVDIIF